MSLESKYLLILITLTLLLLSIPAPIIIYGEKINRNSYFIYLKQVKIEYYPEIKLRTNLPSILNGYCIEKAKYVVTRVGDQGFILEKYKVDLENRSTTPVTCMYLGIIDVGEKKTWFRGKTDTLVLMFDWKYNYTGPIFTEKIFKNYPLPWLNKVYIYLSRNWPTYLINTTATIMPSKNIERLQTVFYNDLRITYDRSDGFLKELRYIATIMLQGTPYVMITLEISRITTYYYTRENPSYTTYRLAILASITIVFTIGIIWFLKKKIG